MENKLLGASMNNLQEKDSVESVTVIQMAYGSSMDWGTETSKRI